MRKVVPVLVLLVCVLNVVRCEDTSESSSDSDGPQYYWTGNFQLKQAFDTALMQLKLDGTIRTILNRNALTDWGNSDCYLNSALGSYSWPPIRDVTGTLRSVLETGVWRILSVEATRNLPYLDTSTTPSQGALYEIFAKVVERVASHYRRPIEIREFKIPASPNNDNIFRALWKNMAESTIGYFSPGGHSLHHKREYLFYPSCSNFAEPITVYTRSAVGITSWTGLVNAYNAAVAANTTVNFAAIGTGNAQAVRAIFPRAQTVTFYDRETALTRVTSTGSLALFGARGFPAGSGTGLNLIPADQVKFLASSVAFFRRDRDLSDECSDVSFALPTELSFFNGTWNAHYSESDFTTSDDD